MFLIHNAKTSQIGMAVNAKWIMMRIVDHLVNSTLSMNTSKLDTMEQIVPLVINITKFKIL
jgi:hypothetical protein